DPAVGFALKRLDRGATVRDVARALDYSPRRLRRHFAAAVGLNPKRYAGLARFHRVVRRVAAGAPDSWADLALDAGYVDQAHLVRDFRAFSGLTPTQYRPRAPDEPNHVPLDEA
ncbi:MAG: helix-turn-helix domain-containing protein, partial [Myxococcales bacterium]|nr:helix-turn-helix domain-containing protein [Myxococcales bacterium]